jgi:hypothetical protein
MDPFLVTLFALPVLGALGAGYSFLTRDLRTKRALRRLRPTRIADARDGVLVKITGKVAPAAGALAAPISQRACVYYHVLHEERGVTMVNAARFERWSEAGEEEDVCDFLVEDASGTAVVKAREVDWPLVILGSGAWTQTVDLEAGQRTREAVLAPGDTITVAGWARWDATSVADPKAPPGLYRDGPRRRLIVHATRHVPLIVSDD